MSKRKEDPDHLPPSYELRELEAEEHGFYPPEELINKLSELPAGTKVGVECPPSLTSARSYEGDELTYFSGREVMYWNYLVAECQRLGLTVFYLDDLELHQRIVRLERIAAITNEDLHPADYVRHPKPHSPTREWQLRRRAYNAQILAQSTKYIERAQAVYRNQKIFGTHTSVMGRDMENMTEVLMLEEMGYLGTDQNSSLYLMNVAPPHFEPSSIDLAALKKRLLLRRTNAIRAAQLIPSRRPDFIGVFQHAHLYTPEEGLFEIYLREGITISGFGIDTFGDSLVSGTVGEHHIEFEKQYLNGRSAGGAAGTLRYNGTFKNDIYQGEWTTSGTRGEFVLVPYQEGLNVRELMDSSLVRI
jgi:hypothetical protein